LCEQFGDLLLLPMFELQSGHYNAVDRHYLVLFSDESCQCRHQTDIDLVVDQHIDMLGRHEFQFRLRWSLEVEQFELHVSTTNHEIVRYFSPFQYLENLLNRGRKLELGEVSPRQQFASKIVEHMDGIPFPFFFDQGLDYDHGKT
jgi:hypothetical protein